ncbi:transmembrane signal receptor [Lithospermum erythrorhizon]|uniref:Transmembrane signal receptor n=1 Tax=Lithospermum erythrorhizon TaxID=34254 RepID=A0AAV3R5K4_LITER
MCRRNLAQACLFKKTKLSILWSMEVVDVAVLQILVIVLTVLLLGQMAMGEPRTQTVKMICGSQTEYNSTIYVPNFVNTMENISEQIRSKGYGLAETGTGYDTNFGFAQCYGDLSLLDCVLCYAEARTILPQCYPETGGRIFLDGCFMRAENYSFFQEYTGPNDTAICGNRTRKNQVFEQMAKGAVLQAVSGVVNNNFSARIEVPANKTLNESVYVLADCWKTLDVHSCRACLENASNSLLGCLPWSEGRALNTGCFMRYSDTNFLNVIPRQSRSRGTLIVVIVASACSAVVVVVGAVIGAYFWKRKRIEKKRKGGNDVKKLVKTLNDSSLNFKYSILEKATGSFSEANKLGQGGFGTVYKGALQDGREIAVKRLFFNNRHRAADFYNEVNIISTLEHKNLVRLLGCSCSGPESLLVYEYLPNKSLDRYIFDSSKGKSLNWEKRFEIIIGTAEGLVYLHENSKVRIIHRDIKASNILLDSRLRAKIADFGLARSFQEDKSHISTAIAGTLGYLAPEYLAHGQLTEKVDVYSFGVLLLEIVTGRQNNKSKSSEYSDSLVNIAWNHFQQRKVEELFDPNLLFHNYHNVSVKHELLRVVHVGLLCTQEIPSLRPSMSKALLMLVKKEEHLPAPTNPPFVDERTMEFHDMIDSSHPSDTGNSDSIASISHSIFYPR